MGTTDTTALDARGPQFNATLTSIVLAVALLTATTPVGVVLLAVQAVLFANGTLLGVRRTPAAYLFGGVTSMSPRGRSRGSRRGPWAPRASVPAGR